MYFKIFEKLDFFGRNLGDNVIADESVVAMPFSVDQYFFRLPDAPLAVKRFAR